MTSDLSAARLAELEAFAVDLARAAGAAILPLFRADNGLEDKGGPGAFDPVTAADRGSEAAMRQAIAARYPHHGVLGEEYGRDRTDAEFVWVLDPIDGTRAFIAGLPVWTTLIGLRHQGEAVVGAISQPYLDEIYVGTALGSRLIRSGEVRTLRTRPCARLRDAVIATTDPVLFKGPGEAGAWEQVRAGARLARLGCDAYAYAMVAAGTMDMVVEAGLKAWDIDAAIPLIAGAGGLVTDWRGAPVGAEGGQVVIAGDRAPLDEALVSLSRAAA
jgi:histidinol phosphatase-like enzyme (inositol monophosphatase family)